VLADPTYQRCPECGKTVPVDRRFVTWCEHCEWDVDPGAKDLDPVPMRAARPALDELAHPAPA
jgi:ribosomal protein L37AE/L43A